MALPKSEATRVFGRTLLQARLNAGLTQADLSEASSLHWTNVARLERGEIEPLLHSIIKLEAALGLSPGFLLAGLTVDTLPFPEDVILPEQFYKPHANFNKNQ